MPLHSVTTGIDYMNNSDDTTKDSYKNKQTNKQTNKQIKSLNALKLRNRQESKNTPVIYF